jgi:hypothetical protein
MTTHGKAAQAPRPPVPAGDLVSDYPLLIEWAWQAWVRWTYGLGAIARAIGVSHRTVRRVASGRVSSVQVFEAIEHVENYTYEDTASSATKHLTVFHRAQMFEIRLDNESDAILFCKIDQARDPCQDWAPDVQALKGHEVKAAGYMARGVFSAWGLHCSTLRKGGCTIYAVERPLPRARSLNEALALRTAGFALAAGWFALGFAICCVGMGVFLAASSSCGGLWRVDLALLCVLGLPFALALLWVPLVSISEAMEFALQPLSQKSLRTFSSIETRFTSYDHRRASHWLVGELEPGNAQPWPKAELPAGMWTHFAMPMGAVFLALVIGWVHLSCAF